LAKVTNSLLLFALVLFIPQLLLSSVVEDFERGNRFYEERHFDSAITLYSGIIDSGVESAAIYFNLGNSHFKNGDLGHAVLSYLRAQRLDPTDDDISANLELAQSFTSLQMADVPLNPGRTFLNKLLLPLRLDTLAWISSALFILFILFLIVRFGLGQRRQLVRTATVFTIILLIFSSLATTWKYRESHVRQHAVIVSETSPIHTGPSEQADIDFEGASGLVVEIIGETEDFFHVRLENTRSGWIKKDLIAPV